MTKSNLRAHRSVLQRLYFLKQDGEYAHICVVMVYTDSYKSFNNVVLQNGFSSCEGRGQELALPPTYLTPRRSSALQTKRRTGGALMARCCIYSLSLFVCHQPSTAAPQQQYADSGMMAPPPLNISSHGNLSESDCTFCFFFSAS